MEASHQLQLQLQLQHLHQHQHQHQHQHHYQLQLLHQLLHQLQLLLQLLLLLLLMLHQALRVPPLSLTRLLSLPPTQRTAIRQSAQALLERQGTVNLSRPHSAGT